MCCNVIMVPMEVVEDVIRNVEMRMPINTMPDWPARRVSVFPKATMPVVVWDTDCLIPTEKKWGFEPSWSKTVLFNTRVETAADPQNRFWKDSLANRRCFVPVYSFFEPHKTETTLSARTGKRIKQQYRFEAPDAPLLFLVGIFNEERFSIMTTEPNRWMQPIHHRMPLVLRQNELLTWLTGDYASLFNRSDVELAAFKASAN